MMEPTFTKGRKPGQLFCSSLLTETEQSILLLSQIPRDTIILDAGAPVANKISEQFVFTFNIYKQSFLSLSPSKQGFSSGNCQHWLVIASDLSRS